MATTDTKLTFSVWPQKGLGQRLETTTEYHKLKDELQKIDVCGKVELGLADDTMGGSDGWYGCTGLKDCIGCKPPEDKDVFENDVICVYITVQKVDKETVDNLQSLSKQIHDITGYTDTCVFNEEFEPVEQTYYIYPKPTGRQVLDICKKEKDGYDIDMLNDAMPWLFTETIEQRKYESAYGIDKRWVAEPTGKYTMKLKLQNGIILTALTSVKKLLMKISGQSN